MVQWVYLSRWYFSRQF